MSYYRFFVAAMALVCGCGTFWLTSYGRHNVQGAEVVRNDFERNYDGWYANSDSGRLVATAGAGFDGSRGMVLSGRRNERDGACSSKGLYLKGGRSYEYSVQVYSETPETFRFELLCRSGFFAPPTVVQIATQEVKAGEWTKLAGSCAAPENGSDFLLTIATNSKNDFRFDDVCIIGEPCDELVTAASEKGLKDDFADSFRVGNIFNSRTINNRDVAALILKNFNSLECENETKPFATMVRSQSSGTEIAVTLKQSAAIFDFAIRNNLPFRGHTLVWHSQTPTWFFKENFDDRAGWADVATMDARMESYIKNLFDAIETQYPDLELYAYDVCNECVANSFPRLRDFDAAREPGDSNREHEKSAWVQIYGDNSFVEKAFVCARKYAPDGCLLFYNDYNEYWPPKREAIYKLCKSLYEKGLLDGIGMQSHVSANLRGVDGVEGWTETMKKYLSIGCAVHVTELDVTLNRGQFSLEDQAAKYVAIFKAAKEWNDEHDGQNRVQSICLWGPNDANSWLPQGSDGLVFDRNNEPKPAYNALREFGAQGTAE